MEQIEFLEAEIRKANKEHLTISRYLIDDNDTALKSIYGSLNNAKDRLFELEYFLNNKEWIKNKR